MPEGNGYAPGAAPRKANDNQPPVHRLIAAVIILELSGSVAVDSGRPVASAHENTPAAWHHRSRPRRVSARAVKNCFHPPTPKPRGK